MLRLLFVGLIGAFGIYWAAQGAFYALLLYLWIAYFRPEAWVWNAAVIQALNISLWSGVYLLLRSPGSDAKFRLERAHALLFLFLALSLLSTINSAHSEWAWQWWQDFAKAVIISYLLTALTTDFRRFRMVVLVIALSLGFEAAKQGWVSLILRPGGMNSNPLSQLGDNNGVAVGMFMLAPLFLALAQTSTVRWERWLHYFFATGVVYRGLSTYSRGGFMAAAAMMGVYVLRSQRKMRAVVAAVAVALVVLTVLPQAFWERMGTITVEESEIQQDSSSRSRLHFWEVARDMANAHPFLGVGFYAYNPAYNDYDFSRGTFGKGRSVHSSWFGVLAELGYIGLALYILILAQAVHSTGRVALRAKQQKIPSEYGAFGAAVQAGLAAFCVGGSFVAWQYVEMLWHYIGLTIALGTLARATEAAGVAVLAAAPQPALAQADGPPRPAGWPAVAPRRTTRAAS